MLFFLWDNSAEKRKMTDKPKNAYGEPYEAMAYCRKKVLENMQWAFDLFRK